MQVRTMSTSLSLKQRFAKSVGAPILMTVLTASALGGAIPEAQAGGNHDGLQVSVKVMEYGTVPLSSDKGAAEAGHGIFKDDHGTGHSSPAHADGHHDLPPTVAQNYYKSVNPEAHDSHSTSGHGEKSSHGGRMASVVFGYGGHYGDASGYVNFVQDNHGKVSLYDLRASIHASANQILGANFHLGPISDVGMTARIDHAHGPDHEGSLRYAVGPGVDFYDGALRVNALFRDDIRQPGATGQMSATWNTYTSIAGYKTQLAGYADAIGKEGKAAPNATVKAEIWTQIHPSFYVGGFAKAKVNADGVQGDHEVQGGVGIKIPLI
jgi:hypothetical protein